ncbi:MAG: 16S rRNA (uracil(1498)-N(3))-methyltransferase [Anaerolineae bacterium]|nr:16S rRNA (uracil(1498)-N(3))-methyltransferase [Anaerolineae bacterium]
MHRFFIPPEWIQGRTVTLNGAIVHQIRHVLRLRPGDHILVLDNSGWEWKVELTEVSKNRVEGRTRGKSLARGEPRTKITLYQGVLKGNRFEFALQKGTEVGVVEFVPVVSSRCVIANVDAVEKKLPRWRRIVLEAAEQAHRGRLPVIQPAMLFAAACERARLSGGLSILPWEEAEASLKLLLRGGDQGAEAASRPFSINLFIGPEGGFSADEVNLAQRYGIHAVTLGPRILRAETAGLVAAAAILYELGDLER